jgi:hypothetical protein
LIPRRNVAALLLCALAVLGIQRVPCLLAGVGGEARAAARELPPCHRPAPEPGSEERPSPCSQCASLHRALGGALSASDTDAPPLLLAHGVAAAWGTPAPRAEPIAL